MSIERKSAGTASYTEYKGDDRKAKDEETRGTGFMTRAKEIRSGGKSNPDQDKSPPTFGTPSLRDTLSYYDQHRKPLMSNTMTSIVYARFVDLTHVNSLIGTWNLKHALTMKSGKMIATLELYDNGAYMTESSCLEFLLDIIVSAEGMRWATKQGILA